MTIFTEGGTREEAMALIPLLQGLKLVDFCEGQPRVLDWRNLDLRASLLWAAHNEIEQQHDTTKVVYVALSRDALRRNRTTSSAVADRLARPGRRAWAWPGHEDPFVLLTSPDAASAVADAHSVVEKVVFGLKAVTMATVEHHELVDNLFVVECIGTDLVSAMGMPGVCARKCRSRSVHDTMRALGVEAAAAAALREIQRLVGVAPVARAHLMLFADIMVRTGEPLAFNRYGMVGAKSGPLARSIYETPVATLVKAALRGETDDLSSLLTQIFCGIMLRVGTGAVDILYDLGEQS